MRLGESRFVTHRFKFNTQRVIPECVLSTETASFFFVEKISCSTKEEREIERDNKVSTLFNRDKDIDSGFRDVSCLLYRDR